jgi:hypothetical protein
MTLTEKGPAIFKEFVSMMIDATKSHTGQAGKQPGKTKARENEAILWSVNAMFLLAAQKQALAGGELDADISALKAALQGQGLTLPTIDATGRDKSLNMVYYALRRRLQGGNTQDPVQYHKDEAILWAGSRLSRLKDEVRDLETAVDGAVSAA